MSNIILMEQFRDKQVRIVRKSPKEVMIPVNDIADAINYDHEVLRRLVNRNQEVLGRFTGKTVMVSPGGVQETMCLNRDGVIGLLMKIDHNRIKDEKKRQDIIDFQVWAIETLGRILDGEMPQQEFQPWADKVGEHLKLAKYLSENSGVKLGIASAAALNTASQETGRDLSAYQQLLPPAEHETAHLTPTDVAKQLKTSAAKLNKLLAEIGLIKQHQDEKGRKYWRITEQGKKYGEEFPYVRNGHSGYQIKWNQSILDKIQPDTTGADTVEDKRLDVHDYNINAAAMSIAMKTLKTGTEKRRV